jgi:PAS domain S-box-containing protein
MIWCLAFAALMSDYVNSQPRGFCNDAAQLSRHDRGVLDLRRLKKNLLLMPSAELLTWLAFAATSEAQILSSLNRNVVTANAAACRLFGCTADDLSGRPMREVYATVEDWQIVSEALKSKTSASAARLYVTLRQPSGHLFDGVLSIETIIDQSGAACGYKESFYASAVSETAAPAPPRDLSEQVRLARGMAHDFNNLLAIIGGNVQLASQRTTDKKTKSLLREAELACDMGARLTDAIKSFAADRRLAATEINIADLLRGQLPLIARTLGNGITLTCDVAPKVPPVFADRSGLENAILNLVLNARDAMPGGGSICVRAASIKNGAGVRISLIDTGTGMTPRILARAFDPFFTTKPPGQGTGLGLATVYGFAKQSGGCAEIESTPGAGTTVSIILPSAAVLR